MDLSDQWFCLISIFVNAYVRLGTRMARIGSFTKKSVAFIWDGFVKIEPVEILLSLYSIRKTNYSFNCVTSWTELWDIKYLELKRTCSSWSPCCQMNVQMKNNKTT